MTRHAWERNDVADVLEAGHEHDQPLEAKTEACVWHSAVATQVRVPPNVRRLESALDAPLFQYLQVVLSARTNQSINRQTNNDQNKWHTIIRPNTTQNTPLRTTDEFSDLGHEDVHGGDSLIIVVQLHVECLDTLRVVGHDRRPLKHL